MFDYVMIFLKLDVLWKKISADNKKEVQYFKFITLLNMVQFWKGFSWNVRQSLNFLEMGNTKTLLGEYPLLPKS
jgi:hypothetical protein